MHMYPAYKLRDVMEEHAITFLTMLNEGYKTRNTHYYRLAHIAILSIMKDEPRNKVLKQMELSTKDPSDILRSSDNASSTDEVKKFLGKI